MSLRFHILSAAFLGLSSLSIGAEQPLKFDVPPGWQYSFHQDNGTFFIAKRVETDKKGRLPYPSNVTLKRCPPSYDLHNTRGHIDEVASKLQKEAPRDTFTIAHIGGTSFEGHLVYHKLPWNGLSAMYELSNGKEVWFGMYVGDESDFAIVLKILKSLH